MEDVTFLDANPAGVEDDDALKEDPAGQCGRMFGAPPFCAMLREMPKCALTACLISHTIVSTPIVKVFASGLDSKEGACLCLFLTLTL